MKREQPFDDDSIYRNVHGVCRIEEPRWFPRRPFLPIGNVALSQHVIKSADDFHVLTDVDIRIDRRKTVRHSRIIQELRRRSSESFFLTKYEEMLIFL